MTGSVTWETLLVVVGLATTLIGAVGTVVGGALIWMHKQVREIDKALAAFDKGFSVSLTTSRHDMRNELQREVAKTDNDIESRRKEIQDLAHRVTRLETRLNGNHPAK